MSHAVLVSGLATQKLMFDTDAFDHVIARPQCLAALKTAIATGVYEVLTTHVQEDQLAGAPAAKRAIYPQITRRQVDTSAFVVGLSKLGMAKRGPGVTYDGIRTPGRHYEDALIADTAQSENAILVTGDGRLQRRARAKGITVWEFGDLDSQLGC